MAAIFWRDASDRLTFDLPTVDAKDYPALCRALAENFSLTPQGSPIVGLDEMFWDFERRDQVVGFDWDIWMKFTVVAKNKQAEPLVRDIASWLSTASHLPGSELR